MSNNQYANRLDVYNVNLAREIQKQIGDLLTVSMVFVSDNEIRITVMFTDNMYVRLMMSREYFEDISVDSISPTVKSIKTARESIISNE